MSLNLNWNQLLCFAFDERQIIRNPDKPTLQAFYHSVKDTHPYIWDGPKPVPMRGIFDPKTGEHHWGSGYVYNHFDLAKHVKKDHRSLHRVYVRDDGTVAKGSADEDAEYSYRRASMPGIGHTLK